MSTRKIVIKIDERGCGSIVVNGMEVAHMVRSTLVYTQAGLPTKVEIEFFPELVTLEAQAVLRAEPARPDALRATQADGFIRHRKQKGRK